MADEKDHVGVIEENRRLKKFRGVCDTCGWRTEWSYDESEIRSEVELHMIKKKRAGSIWDRAT